ncbi:MAG: FAD:protein FMN transferase [Gammaproteobacteria bacterium]|jgi:thiamine biosynthesis lipoprotein|nr:FAD:protein FMN transferase [Gammaproteobacteria bacterium]
MRARLSGPLVRLFALVLIALATFGCAPREEQAYKRQFFALGTLVEITLWGVDEERAAQAVRSAENAINAAHMRWHAWQPGELTDINAALAAGRSFTASPETAVALRQARTLAIDSGHLFNPAIGALVQLWGFHDSERPLGPPPPASAITPLLAAAPRMEQLEIDEDGRVSSANPAVQLDLGAFAKGHAVDQAIAALRELGITDAIVNAGGDLRAIGRHGARPWRIGIRQADGAGVFASVEVEGDESLFTSGDYERYFEFEGKRYHHILDPRSGMPAAGTHSVTIIHDEGATADAAATALFVAGPREWAAVANALGITQAMLVDADMTVHMTPAMAGRVHFENSPPPTTRVVDPS